MIKVTLEFNTQAELLAFFANPAGAAPKAEKAASIETSKKSSTTAGTASTTASPAKSDSSTEVKPAAEPSAPAADAAATASTTEPSASVGIAAEELTKAVVSAVARTDRETVLAMLQTKFGVKAGKEITDPVIRAKAKAELDALA